MTPYVVWLLEEGVAYFIVISFFLLVGILFYRIRARNPLPFVEFEPLPPSLAWKLDATGYFNMDVFIVSIAHANNDAGFVELWCDWEWEDGWYIRNLAPGFSNLKSDKEAV